MHVTQTHMNGQHGGDPPAFPGHRRWGRRCPGGSATARPACRPAAPGRPVEPSPRRPPRPPAGSAAASQAATHVGWSVPGMIGTAENRSSDRFSILETFFQFLTI